MVKRRRTLKAKRRMNISRPRASMGRASMRRAVANLSINRTRYDGAWTFATTTTSDFWKYQTFTTGNINNFAEFASVFDEYKICAIKQTWRPRFDSVNAPSAVGTVAQPQAYAHIILDPSSTLVPTGTYSLATVNTFLENGRVKTKTLNRPFSVYFKPKVQMTVGSGTSSTSSKWLKTTNTSVAHSGYHILLQQNNLDTSNTNIVLDSFITMYVKFRGLR